MSFCSKTGCPAYDAPFWCCWGDCPNNSFHLLCSVYKFAALS
ncbi:hypothetical protein HMPREF1546_01279 [Oscillibacter sp. KLE 1745]|nr:hypothetical protein HMPREF1546_01279 [Oscillibacter sp. KLE 1745]